MPGREKMTEGGGSGLRWDSDKGPADELDGSGKWNRRWT